jgi:hypothetical protein
MRALRVRPLRVAHLVEVLERAQPGVLHDVLGVGLG